MAVVGGSGKEKWNGQGTGVCTCETGMSRFEGTGNRRVFRGKTMTVCPERRVVQGEGARGKAKKKKASVSDVKNAAL